MKYNLIQEPSKKNVIEQILLNRQIKNPSHYLNTSEADLFSENLLDNIQTGIDILLNHIHNHDEILLIIDSDADGYTSAAILLNYLHRIFPLEVENNIDYVTHHPKKEHGITDKIFDKETSLFFNAKDYKLVICPDSASNDFEAHRKLKDKNVDVLVLDHHEIDTVSEDACIINNQTCDYPNKSLSGAGIVYKFCLALDKRLNTDYAKEFIDLTALGCISDMMDIRNYETKEIIDQGFNQIQNPFFKYMVNKNNFSIGEVLSPIKVSFYVTPFINAVVRSGTLDEKILLFKSFLDYEALKLVPSNKRGHEIGAEEKLVDQALRMCTNVKRRQTNEEKKFTEIVSNIIEKNNLLENKILVIRLEDIEIQPNLTGLIANKITSLYQKPTCILNKTRNSAGDILWSGSARNYNYSELENFKDFCSNSNLVELAEGHQSAFGVQILDSNFKKFIEYANEQLKDYSFSVVYNVDYIFDGADRINTKAITEIASFKSLWGQNIEEPLLLLKNIIIKNDNIDLIGKNKDTIRIKLQDGLTLMMFRSSSQVYAELTPFPHGYTKVSFLVTCEINSFMGMDTPQCIVKDFEITDIQKLLF